MRVDAAKRWTERSLGAVAIFLAVIGPFLFNDYWVGFILTQTFLLGIAAASLIFLSAYGGMVSLAQVALYGIAGFALGNMVTTEGKGLILGWNPWLSIVLAILITTLIGFVFGAISSRSAGIYFLMITLTYSVIANYFFGQVTVVSGFSGISGIDLQAPSFVGAEAEDPTRLYYVALVVAVLVYVLLRFVRRTPFGIALQGVRDEPVRMASLGFSVPLHRTLAFTLAAFVASLAGILYVWWNGQIDPATIGLQGTIDLLIIAVLGGLGRLEGAWVGAFFFIVINNYVRDVELPVVGGSFNTIIGLVFLAIVVLSPDGLSGLWDRAWGLIRRGGAGTDRPAVATGTTGPG
ncbi:MAG: branched-chain amino acid ABC transporter permease [Gaiella sp.]